MTDLPKTAPGDGHRGTWIGQVLVFGTMTCFAAIVVQFAQWLFPQWDWRGLLAVCGVASIEAMLSFWVVLKLPTAQRQIGFYRFTEWVIILAGLKIFTELRAGPAHLMGNVQQWGINFPINLLNGEFLINLLIVFLTWEFSTLFAADLHLLEIDEAVRIDERVTHTTVRDMVLRQTFYLGMVVILLSGLMLQDVSFGSHPNTSAGLIPIIVLFFFFGLALLSLTRYASLQSAWRQAGINIPSQIPRRWLIYSFIILVFLASLSVILPTHYGMGFFETVLAVIRLVGAVITYLFALIVFLISTVARLLNKGPSTPQEPIIAATPPPEMLPPPAPASANNLWGSVIFWTILVGFLVIAVRQYILYNQDLLEEIKRFKPIGYLITAWNRLMVSIRNANKKVGEFLQARLEQLRTRGGPQTGTNDWNYVSLRRLTVRQKIFYYYLALVKRAGETTLPRQTDQTPYEYARLLESTLPEGDKDVQALTESFVEARYSRHDLPAENANRTRTAWETLRRLLKRKPASPEEEPPKTI